MKTTSGLLGSNRGYNISAASCAIPLPVWNSYLFKKIPQGSQGHWLQNLTNDKPYEMIGEEAAALSILRGAKPQLGSLVDLLDSFKIPGRSNTLFSTESSFKLCETYPQIFEMQDKNNIVSEISIMTRLSQRRSTTEVLDGMIACVGDRRKWDRKSLELDLSENTEILQTMHHIYDELC